MPLAGPVSYLSVADQFLEHWSRVNQLMGDGGSLELGHGIDRDAVIKVRKRLMEAQEAVTKSRIAREEERRHLSDLDAMIGRRVMQFNLSQVTEAAVETPDELVRVWLALEKEGRQIELDGGFSRLDFVTDLSARKLVATALSSSERSLSSARGIRDGAQEQLHAYLEFYRERIEERFPKGDDIRDSLPALDLRPGLKPMAVAVFGRWQDAAAVIAWEPSDEPELDHYEVRAMAGDHYEAEDEVCLAVIPPDGPWRHSSGFALEEAGSIATFRVYVVLRSGHERGSQPVTVVRN